MNSQLLELKASVEFLNPIRNIILNLKAVHIGTFRQVDTYFDSPKGRLKLREINGREKVQLIYYCREDNLGPKRSENVVVEVQEPDSFKTIFNELLSTTIVIDKEREIYKFEDTQIHLDTVKNLGTFVEFERKITDLTQDYRVLEELMKKLELKQENLIQGSYSDLAITKQQNGKIR